VNPGLRLPGPHKNALVVISVAIAMTALFAISYSLVLGRATPHRIIVGLVGAPDHERPLLTALEQATEHGMVFHPYPSATAAEEAIDQQSSYAALVLGHGAPRLLVSSASGYSVARVLEQAAEQLALKTGLRIDLVDLHPLPPSDPQGLVSFYLTLASSILGFVTMFQLRANAPGLGFRNWLAVIAVLAVAGGLVLASVADPLIHRWAIVPTWGLFVILGNTSSGGAVAQPLLPPFYAFIGRFLPPGATVTIVRTAVYFRRDQHLEPFIVQGIWLACLLTALVVLTRTLRREPGTLPGQFPGKPARWLTARASTPASTARVSAGSITSSISNAIAVLTALPRAYCSATSSS
jgi:hypothetical protein